MIEDTAAKIAARLKELWRTSRPTILERISLLRSACDRLTENPADREARSTGREAAHKLSGVLGVFGLPQGSEIASSIEFLLKSDQPPTAKDLVTLRAQIADLDAMIASRESS
ncbi:MAG: Hpt domain-containing protein [Acidobacteriaceae bacterium]|jgi:HPt (histidine-containing phosphotransfer) domain-containing protein